MASDVAGMPASPAIGIFWVLAERGKPPQVLADCVAVDRGETYGEFLTYGGHYEYWEGLSALGVPELRRRGLPTAVVWSEYEEWPRGRVVFKRPTSRFIVYADRKLRPPSILGLVLARFGLQHHAVTLLDDPHYVSVRPES